VVAIYLAFGNRRKAGPTSDTRETGDLVAIDFEIEDHEADGSGPEWRRTVGYEDADQPSKIKTSIGRKTTKFTRTGFKALHAAFLVLP
jgi:hypothetical protein